MEGIRHPNQTIKRKTKGASLFPKLNKIEASPVESKLIGRSMGKKYCAESIFKVKQEKPQVKCLRIGMDQDWVSKSKQYQEIQAEMNECRRKHHQDMAHINKLKQDKEKETQARKKDSYTLKLSLWELKNDVFDLTTSLKDQQEEYDRLLNELGYEQAEPESQEAGQMNSQKNGQSYSQYKAEQLRINQESQLSETVRNNVYSTQTLRERSEEESEP